MKFVLYNGPGVLAFCATICLTIPIMRLESRPSYPTLAWVVGGALFLLDVSQKMRTFPTWIRPSWRNSSPVWASSPASTGSETHPASLETPEVPIVKQGVSILVMLCSIFWLFRIFWLTSTGHACSTA